MRVDGEHRACPQRYCWHSWKNATQMPAISWRLTRRPVSASLGALGGAGRHGGADWADAPQARVLGRRAGLVRGRAPDRAGLPRVAADLAAAGRGRWWWGGGRGWGGQWGEGVGLEDEGELPELHQLRVLAVGLRRGQQDLHAVVVSPHVGSGAPAANRHGAESAVLGPRVPLRPPHVEVAGPARRRLRSGDHRRRDADGGEHPVPLLAPPPCDGRGSYRKGS